MLGLDEVGTILSIQDMVEKKFFRVEMNDERTQIEFECPEGLFVMYHSQDCCEDVHVESIVGELEYLVGTPILVAEETVSDDPAFGGWGEFPEGSGTWTFYKFVTLKGYVDIRWIGESNGYYSEEVTIKFTPRRKQ